MNATKTWGYVVKHQPHKTRTDVGGWIVGSQWTGTVVERYATQEEAEAVVREIRESLERVA
jgi:hypothetical protein